MASLCDMKLKFHSDLNIRLQNEFAGSTCKFAHWLSMLLQTNVNSILVTHDKGLTWTILWFWNNSMLIINSIKLVIPLHLLYWSIHTKNESKCRTAFAFIFGVNWLWRCGVTASFGVFFLEIKCNRMTSFMEFMGIVAQLLIFLNTVDWVQVFQGDCPTL